MGKYLIIGPSQRYGGLSVRGSPPVGSAVTPRPTNDSKEVGDLLGIVFTNLLENAIKFSSSQAKATIEIGRRLNNDGIEIYVKDNGVGFNPEDNEKLFGVFQRLHREKEFPGTGIGLANVKRITQSHGGYVDAVGEVGKGATFSILLPDQLDIPQ